MRKEGGNRKKQGEEGNKKLPGTGLLGLPVCVCEGVEG